MRLGAVLAAVCLGACGVGPDKAPIAALDTSSTTTVAATQTAPLTGTVLVAVTCPIAVPPRPCPPQPAAGADVEVRAGESRDGPVVATTRAGADGRYSVLLRPGRYVVSARVDRATCSGVPVTVPATADVTCSPNGSP